MRKIIILSALFTLFQLSASAQTMENGILPENGKAEEYTEWKKVELTVGSEKVTYEYRIAFLKRKALACYYDIQIKNTSSAKIKVKLKTHYTDKMLNRQFGDEFKETIKPGVTQPFTVIVQGCKADKDKKDQSDFDRCKSSELFYEIYIED